MEVPTSTTVAPPSPEKSPPSPPQNPHNPKKASPITARNMANFRSLLLKVAGPLSPAHRSHIEQRFADILPTEFLVPDHPPYADMILNALWELKANGGSSVEAISHYIETEYQNLPWAHATMLKHHLRDLCTKRKITLINDSCYILSSLVTNPEPSPSSSPLSSSCSSSSASFCTSPTSSSCSPSPSSSSSGLGWSGRYRTRKRKNVKRRKGKKVPARGGDRGRVRGRSPVTIRVGQRGRGRFDVDGSNKVEPERGSEAVNEVTVIEDEDYSVKDGDVPVVVADISEEKNMSFEENKVEEPKQEREHQNEVTVIDDEDYSIKDGDVPDVIAKVSEEDNLPCEGNNQEVNQPQRKYNVTWIGRRVRKIEEAKSDSLDIETDDVSDASVDEHVEQSEEIEENRQCDTIEIGEQSADLHHDHAAAAVAVAAVDDDNNDGASVTDEPIHPQEECDEKTDESCKHHQMKNAEVELAEYVEQLEQMEENLQSDSVEIRAFEDEQLMDDVKTGPNKQLDYLTKEQVETKEQSADPHPGHDAAAAAVADDGHGDGVTEQPIDPQEECDEKTEESHESGKQDRMKNAEAGSSEHVEQLEQREENERSDTVSQQALEDDQLMDDEKTEPNERLDQQVETNQQSEDLHHDHDADAVADDGHGDGVTEQPIDPQEECDEKTEESHDSDKQDQMKNAEAGSSEHVEQLEQREENEQSDTVSQQAFEDDQVMDDEKTEPDKQLDLDAETEEQSADLHHDHAADGHVDGVTEEPVHPQEEHDEKTEEPHESCKQDQMKNVEAESAAQEEQQTAVNLEKQFLDEVQQATSENEKHSLQNYNNPTSKENTASSGSTVRPPPRQGLRSSSKIEDETPNPKKQLEVVTPVRRRLRSNKANSEAAIITEVLDNSNEQRTQSGRTRSSKRKIPEAEQASSNMRKTRRSGL